MNKSKKELLKKDALYLTTILLIIIDEYGAEALNWDPETIVMELEEDSGVSLSESVIAKIGCGLQIMTTDTFYKSLPDFIIDCNIVSGDLDSTNLWNPADAYEIVSTVSEVKLLNPPTEETVFSPDIISYIELMLREIGVITPPDCLKFIESNKLAIQDIGTVQDDPTLFAASYQMAQDTSQELQDYEDAVLTEILTEIRQLALENGSLESIFGRTNGNHYRTR